MFACLLTFLLLFSNMARLLLFFCFLLFVVVGISGNRRCITISGKSVTCDRVRNHRLRDFSEMGKINVISYTNMNFQNGARFCDYLPRTVRWLNLRNLRGQRYICDQIRVNCLFKINILRGCEDVPPPTKVRYTSNYTGVMCFLFRNLPQPRYLLLHLLPLLRFRQLLIRLPLPLLLSQVNCIICCCNEVFHFL